MKYWKNSLWIIALLSLLALRQPAQAQQEPIRYFPETGHAIMGEFLQFYESFPQALLVFGYPITESFVTDSPPGLTVQYFQKARFELHPGLPPGRRVILSPLGAYLYTPGVSSIPIHATGPCRSFPNGYSVCYDFLTFYQAYGDVLIFGYPISNFELLADGRIVQYFERARFEWHPELPAGNKVMLTDLGRLYFEKVGEDPARLNATIANPIISTHILTLRPQAFVWKAVTAPDDTQRIFVVVRNQANQPMAGVRVHIWVRLSEGERYFQSLTDALGVARVDAFSFADQQPGSLIEVRVLAEHGGVQGHSVTSFRIWR